MKIAVLTGSPHKNGVTALLADRFVEGARTKGHEVYRFDAAFRNIAVGCGRKQYAFNNAQHCQTL